MNRKRTIAYLLCQILGWGVYVTIGLLFYASSDEKVRHNLGRYGGAFACSAVVGILTTHWYRFFIKRRGWLLLSPLRAVPRIVLASAVLTVLMTAQISVLWLVFGIGEFATWSWVAPALFSWMWPCLLWHVLYFGVHYFEQYRRAEMEKLQFAVIAKEAQLQRLISQINPHFLFNCLNSLRSLITEDSEQAKRMVTGLSELLRYALQSGKSATVPLSAELEMVKTYLKLEAMRFEDRLAVEIDAAPETLSVPVPTMLVQSLVENGVKHGIEKLQKGGELRVTSRMLNGSLEIQVINSGQLGNGGASTGIGLANARERLRLLYGKAATLSVENQGTQCVRAEMLIPAPREQT